MQVQYKDFFDKREARKLEYEKYYAEAIAKREIGFKEGISEFPVPQKAPA